VAAYGSFDLCFLPRDEDAGGHSCLTSLSGISRRVWTDPRAGGI